MQNTLEVKALTTNKTALLTEIIVDKKGLDVNMRKI